MTSIFGNFGANSSQPSGNLFGQTSQPQSAGLFGQAAQPQQQSSGLFGQSTQQPQQQTSGLFGQSTQQPQQTSGLFGQNTQQQSSSGLFGQSNQQSNQPFGQSTQQQSSNLFGQSGQQTKPLFGQTNGQTNNQTVQPTQSLFGQSTQPIELQYGQSTQKPTASMRSTKPIWEEGRGLGPVYRTIPAQMLYLAEKWSPMTLASPFRTYLYQKVSEENAPFYQPGEDEDPDKWEEAVMKRPGPDYTPVIARGFWELGKRAQRQREYIESCNVRLHDINGSLDAQLKVHNQEVASRFAECRRRHVVAHQRIMGLATKIQILRSRGYALDNAEEELKFKLEQLEKQVFDPMVSGREQEIWARMIGIRERSKQLQMEIERTAPMANEEDQTLDEATVKAAKNALQAYDTQLSHLQKELKLVQDEFADWEKAGMGNGTTI